MEVVADTGRIKVSLLGGVLGPNGVSTISVLPAKVYSDPVWSEAAAMCRAPRRGYEIPLLAKAACSVTRRQKKPWNYGLELIKAMLQCGASVNETPFWKEEQMKMGGYTKEWNWDADTALMYIARCSLANVA